MNPQLEADLLNLPKLISEAREVIGQIKAGIVGLPGVITQADSLMWWAERGVIMAMVCGGVMFLAWVRKKLSGAS